MVTILFYYIVHYIYYIRYVVSSESEKLKTALKKAILALLIIIFAEIGLTIAVACFRVSLLFRRLDLNYCSSLT